MNSFLVTCCLANLVLFRCVICEEMEVNEAFLFELKHPLLKMKDKQLVKWKFLAKNVFLLLFGYFCNVYVRYL